MSWGLDVKWDSGIVDEEFPYTKGLSQIFSQLLIALGGICHWLPEQKAS